MFELSLAHLNGADREREIAADLRRRQILKLPAALGHPADSRSSATAGTRRPATPLRMTER